MMDENISTKRDLMMELYNFVKDGTLENKLLMKERELSILSSHLSSLNKVFATYNSNEILDVARREAVEFLRDFCFRIPALKLLHGPNSPHGAIDVSRLHSLTQLEIGKAPVHMLVGLRALRQQLQVLICTRCLHSIEILIGKCGGDQSAEEDWPYLHTLNLSFNYLTSLDASLQFLPSLRVLDLSHNQIKNAGKFLECFTELQHLNLSYNSLTRVPSLSQVNQRKLKSLNLRNNNLVYLDDIHLYENLESLELTRNCIYSDQPLLSLNTVWQITRINMQSNPIAQEPLYRQLVTKNLPPGTAFRTVYLDGKPLSEAEIKFIPTQRKAAYHRDRDEAVPPVTITACFAEQSLDSFEESGDYSSSGPTRPLRAKEKKRKKKRIRHVVISEQAQNDDLPTVTPKSLESSYMEDTKKEFERRREEHGHDWLLSLQAPYKKPSVPFSEGDSLNPFDEVNCEDQGEDHQEITESITKRIQDEDGNLIGINKSEDTAAVTADVEAIEVRAEAAPEKREEEASIEMGNSLQKEATGKEVDGSFTELNNTQTSSGIDLEYDFHTTGILITTQELIYESDLAKDKLQRTASEEDLCSPLLVKVAFGVDGQLNEMLLTVKQTHLEESDLNGEVQERLELQSLLSVEVSEKNLPEEGLVPIVELNFEYVRKDRRQRRYCMEDQSSSEMLSAVLEPFWQENQEKTVTQFMSCLKCAKEFPLSKAIMVVDKPKGRKTSDQQEFALNEIPTCPFCGNRFLVEKEHSSFNNGDRTPVIGSLTSAVPTIPLATSSPWKTRENGQMSSSLGREFSLSPKLYSKSSLASSRSESLATVIHPGSTTSTSSDRPDSSFTSEILDVSLRLPESTIPAHSIEGKTPIEDVAHYSRDQLDLLLKSDKYEFRDRYSLMPQVSVETSSLQGTPQRTSGSTAERRTIGQVRDEKRVTGEGVKEDDIYGGKSEFSDEDDFDILEEFHESGKQETVEIYPSVGKSKGMITSSKSVAGLGRNNSNESDIAVLSDREHQESDPRGRVDSVASDNVFGITDLDRSSQKGRKLSYDKEEEGSGYLSSYERKTTDSSLNGSGSFSDRESRKERKTTDSSLNESGSFSDRESRKERKTTDSSLNESGSFSDREGRKERKVSMLMGVRDDLESADHRLKLFYSMSLFSSDDEQFWCHVVGNICTSTMLGLVYYEGLVVVSTSHIYVLKVVKEESEKPSDFLSKKLNFLFQELLYVHVGAGSQLLQFEFAADGGRFTLMMGDNVTVEKFAQKLQDSMSTKEKQKFKGVERDHMEVKDSLLALLSEDDNVTNLEQTIYIHTLDTKQKDASLSYMRQGVFITEKYIYLLVENCSWPLVGLNSSKVTSRGQHFALKELFSITDVTDLECSMQELKVVINFSDEDEEREGQWELKLLTPSSIKQLVDAINRPWSEQFGVELTVTFVDT